MEWLGRLGKPMALIDLEAPGFHSVNPDNRAGALMATEHLIGLGRRRIAFVGGSLAHYSIAQRALGYRQAFFDAGLLYDPDLETAIAPGRNLELGADTALRKLLALETPPDAIFSCNDATALAIVRCCARLGLRVPQDLPVIGFDDLPSASLATPPLSTIAIDKERLGRAGMALLLGRNPADPPHATLPVTLVPRASTLLEPTR
jgi:DNA-binding LacI/PurR family transcriptional regulator